MDISTSIHLLGDLLGRVLSEQESPAIFAVEERIRLAAKARRTGDEDTARSAGQSLSDEVATLPPETARAIASAFALYFDLVNLAEDAQRVRALRQEEAKNDPEPVEDSIEDAIAILYARGVTSPQMAACWTI